eukprot:Amastigsp_a509302_6.p2 type:complete len:178 gc:universal Amastigsp_a509302_6:549-16(-)
MSQIIKKSSTKTVVPDRVSDAVLTTDASTQGSGLNFAVPESTASMDSSEDAIKNKGVDVPGGALRLSITTIAQLTIMRLTAGRGQQLAIASKLSSSVGLCLSRPLVAQNMQQTTVAGTRKAIETASRKKTIFGSVSISSGFAPLASALLTARTSSSTSARRSAVFGAPLPENLCVPK